MRKTLKYGIIVGLTNTLVMLFEYLMEWDVSPLMRNVGYVSLIVLALGIYYGIKSKRDNEMEGCISYTQALLSGVLIALFVGIITGAFSYLYFRSINPDLADILIGEKEEMMNKLHLTDEKKLRQLQWLHTEYSPRGQMIFSFANSLLLGVIFSSISSFFLHIRRSER